VTSGLPGEEFLHGAIRSSSSISSLTGALRTAARVDGHRRLGGEGPEAQVVLGVRVEAVALQIEQALHVAAEQHRRHQFGAGTRPNIVVVGVVANVRHQDAGLGLGHHAHQPLVHLHVDALRRAARVAGVEHAGDGVGPAVDEKDGRGVVVDQLFEVLQDALERFVARQGPAHVGADLREERILQTPAGRFGAQARVRHRHRDVLGERDQQGYVVFAIGLVVLPVDDLEHPAHGAAPHERNRDQRLDLEPELLSSAKVISPRAFFASLGSLSTSGSRLSHTTHHTGASWR
jgi:hypothetical protein